MSQLFRPISLRDHTIRNRVWVSPMCQYSAIDGVPNDWHLVHLGSFAKGGAGLVLTEASAVVPEGRISPADAGIWNDEQARAWSRIVDFLHSQGASAGIQLAHAGRKASTHAPWVGRGPAGDEDGGWEPVGPSDSAYPGLREPRALSAAEIASVVTAFGEAAVRSVAAGFDVLELHAAHGYLFHEFLSPLSNQRDDEYGGSFDNRARLLLDVVREVRQRVSESVPLLVRISASDWLADGWSIDDSVRLSSLLGNAGVDLVDVSSGGNAPAEIPLEPGYQADFARQIRAEAGIATGAVGLITEPKHAEEIVAGGAADVVLLGRVLLRDPHWALRAAHELGVPVGEGVDWPVQYQRAALD